MLSHWKMLRRKSILYSRFENPRRSGRSREGDLLLALPKCQYDPRTFHPTTNPLPTRQGVVLTKTQVVVPSKYADYEEDAWVPGERVGDLLL